jgi:hypothetical protein
MPPQVFHRIEFRGIGRQAFNDNPTPGAPDVSAHQGTAVNRSAIPEDQQLAGQMALQMLEKLDDLRSVDA